MSIKVFKYGLLPPTENADAVTDQLRHAHRYRNKLTEMENTRRSDVRSVVEAAVADELAAVAQTKKAKQAARKSLAQSNAENRSRKKSDPKLRKAYQEATEKHKTASKALKKARSAAFKKHKQTIKEIDQKYKDALKAARADTPTYWGTYLVVEDAHKISAGETHLWQNWTDPLDLRFRRWDGQGRLSVQTQKDPRDKLNGLAAEHVFTTNTLVWVDPVDERAWYDPVRGVRRRLSRTKLHLRIGSDKRRPVWAVFPMIMHRPLPDKSRVKRVTVHRRPIGTRVEWTVDFTVDVSNVTPEQYPVEGNVALDLGWRQLDDGSIRVGAWAASDGESGYLTLSPELISSL